MSSASTIGEGTNDAARLNTVLSRAALLMSRMRVNGLAWIEPVCIDTRVRGRERQLLPNMRKQTESGENGTMFSDIVANKRSEKQWRSANFRPVPDST